jgi:[protein-PII] uridylyltransferase
VDEAIRALGEGVGARVALVALGGYGRQSLCPRSDVDLMVLHGERRPDRVRRVAERVFYPFWDAGLQLGHAVRTVKECVGAFSERLDAATALLDARLVWGDEQLVGDLRRDITRAIHGDPAAFIERLREARAVRRADHGSCSQMLEPHLKESTGGLRDIHTIGWIRRSMEGGPSNVEVSALLRPPEARALDEAEEFLVRVRSTLHLETGKRSDRLFLEHQPGIAETFGFEPGAGLDAADALMRGLFQHARQVEHVTDAVFDRASLRFGRPPRARTETPRLSTPDDVMRAFADAAADGMPLHTGSYEAMEEADPGTTPYRWTDRIRRSFLELLAAGDRGERALEAMDRMGLLSRFLPEWEAVRCRPQRDPYHQYTVDVHLMRTVSETVRLLSGEMAGDAVTAEVAAGVEDRHAVLLGAFLHDIGKTGEGPHVDVGVGVAGQVLDRIGVKASTRDHVLFLVRHHLLLSDSATRRDLSDQNLVLDVAASVGTPERLAMLYVLTAADAMATGPHAWTPWRQALVRELVGKVDHVLTQGEEGRDAAAHLEGLIGALRERLRDEDEVAVDVYVNRLPRAYVLAVPTETAARHLRLLSLPIGATELRTEARAGERIGTYDLTVVARDRPGMLAKIAGALALNGMNILSARAFTTEDGVAVDLFVIEPVFEKDVDEDRWRRFRSDLRKAMEGRVSLDYRVREKRRHYPRSKVLTPTSVTIDNGVSDFFTVVEVSAPDRIGLLFDVARAFHELELDVHVAKVATLGARVVDAFYVRDLYGEKIEDPEHIREIERAVLARMTDEGSDT